MFYAENTHSGVGTVTERNGIIQSVGKLVRFETRAERDAWVDADEWDGNYHRAAITRKEATQLFHGAFHVSEWEKPVWCSWKDGEPEEFTGRF